MNPSLGSEKRRRTFKEMQTLHRLRPHFRDVIVEGRDDASLLNWWISENGIPHARAFAVDDRVTVDREMVQEVHRENNARGRVVAAAAQANAWRLSQPTLTCIIDADYDILEPHNIEERDFLPLLTTDFSSMEVYSLAERPLRKFLMNAAKSELTTPELISALRPVWTSLFCLRYILHCHLGGSKLPSRFTNKVSIDKRGIVSFDVKDLLFASSSPPARSEVSELLSLHRDYMDALPDDKLQGIRGHDIAPLLVKFLGLKNKMADSEVVEGYLRQSLETKDLDGHQLFEQLRARLVAVA